MAELYSLQGMNELALEHALISTRLHPEDDGAWLASSFTLKGRCLAQLNLFDEALAAITKALELHRGLEPRDETGEADALNGAGHIYLKLGEFDRAMDNVQQALVLHKHLANWPGVVRTLLLLSDVHDALGRPDDAQATRAHGLAIANELLRGVQPSSV